MFAKLNPVVLMNKTDMNKIFSMAGRSWFRLHIYVTILIFVASCGGSKQMVQVDPFLTNLGDWPFAYQQNYQQVNTFKGKARMTIESEQFSGNVSVNTTWSNPEVLFLQADGPLGINVGKIFIGQNRFLIYNQYSNYFSSGSVEDDYLNRFLVTNFTLNDVKVSALGKAIIPEGVSPELIDARNGIFQARDDAFQYRYIVNPRSGLLESCEVRRLSSVFIKQDFQNYRVVNGVYMPSLIRITMPEQKERLTIFYNEMEINIPVDPTTYAIEVNSQVKQLNLD